MGIIWEKQELAEVTRGEYLNHAGMETSFGDVVLPFYYIRKGSVLIHTDASSWREKQQRSSQQLGLSLDEVIATAYKRGAALVITSELPTHPTPIPILRVENTFKALLALANYSRTRFKGRVVAVTGTAGKSSTRDFLSHLLSQTGPTTVSFGNWNSIPGIAMCIANLPPQGAFAVVEVGGGTLDDAHTRVLDFLRPDDAIITAIGLNDTRKFPTRRVTAEVKSRLFGSLPPTGRAYWPHRIAEMDVLIEAALGCQVRVVGDPSQSTIAVNQIRSGLDSTRVKLSADDYSKEIDTRIVGAGPLTNIALAAQCAFDLGVPAETIAQGIGELSLQTRKMEIVRLKFAGKSVALLDDCHNATLISFQSVFEHIRQISKSVTRCIFVIGRIVHIEESEEAVYESLAGLVRDCAPHAVVLHGEGLELLEKSLADHDRIFVAPTPSDVVPLIESLVDEGSMILLKGSHRGTRIRELSALLRDTGTGSTAEPKEDPASSAIEDTPQPQRNAPGTVSDLHSHRQFRRRAPGATKGHVYLWEPKESEFTGGRVTAATVPLPHLDALTKEGGGLSGRHVEVINAGWVNEQDNIKSDPAAVPIGNAFPDADGNFIFEPESGGGSLDWREPAKASDRARFIAASHFGEVNAYYHITRIAERLDDLLARLGEKPLPKIRVLINAPRVAAESDEQDNGLCASNPLNSQPFEGGTYLLPSHRNNKSQKFGEMWHTGEIHLGQGVRPTKEGWLPRVAGTAYSGNAAHDAGWLYQSYGHHITRHTADFQANAFTAPDRQSNAKTATDMAVSDYWAASMFGTPHIWCWHRRHDAKSLASRNLAGQATMADFNGSAKAHQNGTILASALWDLRQMLEPQGETSCDLLVLATLLSVRRLVNDPYRPGLTETRNLRDGFSVFAACLRFTDATNFDSRYSTHIDKAMKQRGIRFCEETGKKLTKPSAPALSMTLAKTPAVQDYVESVRSQFPDVAIPKDDELLHPDELESRLHRITGAPYDLSAVGDVMTGMRMRHRIRRFGPDYPLAWVKPIFRRSAIVMGNLEGPFAKDAKQEERNYSYKVNPNSAAVLRRAGFRAMTLANNHLLDCGRDGVRETLETLERQGIAAIGAGYNEQTAHDPAILDARGRRIGLLGYYWNQRTAADGNLPGSARDLPERVERDIKRLKPHVDRVAVTVHWGVPYERKPSDENRMKAHHFIDCGADIVIGHHPHIIQPVEIYRERPIIYSVGNFAFGSGNTRAESLLVGVRFLDDQIEVDFFPVCVQNRDPRLDYQPKVMCGEAGMRTLRLLASISGEYGKHLTLDGFYGRLRVAASERDAE